MSRYKSKIDSFFPGNIALDNYWIIQINFDIIKALQVLLLFFVTFGDNKSFEMCAFVKCSCNFLK